MTTETHEGGCHCSAVRYRADLDLAQPVVVCNCSICRKKGSMLSMIPGDSFMLDRGAGELNTYRFASETIAHQFCRVCGVSCFASFTDGNVAVNVRTLDKVDLDVLTTMSFDGASA